MGGEREKEVGETSGWQEQGVNSINMEFHFAIKNKNIHKEMGTTKGEAEMRGTGTDLPSPLLTHSP